MEPILYFLLFILVMAGMVLMVRISDASRKVNELKGKIHRLKGEQPEEQPPEWF